MHAFPRWRSEPINASTLVCKGIEKRFGSTRALDGFELEVEAGITLALLGPSGCGKTTALRVVAGFERPDAGEVRIGERCVAGCDGWVEPEHRRAGMVFQDWALFPHLDVWHNVAFGLHKGETERVREVLELAHLEGLERRMPHELSGGQQQRVALARALAPAPEVILLDEPFSNLDATLRSKVRAEVRLVLQEAKATAIFVTHDREEALSMADRIAIMDKGRVLQVGTPHEVYGDPIDPVVAALIGEANLLQGEVVAGIASTPLGMFPAAGWEPGPVTVLIRPEGIGLRADPEGGWTVLDAEFYGHDQLVRVASEAGEKIEVRTLGPRPDLAAGTRVHASVTSEVRLYHA